MALLQQKEAHLIAGFHSASSEKLYNTLCINNIAQVLKTQEFRTKDFVVRWARSIEHQKCKYRLRRTRRRIRNYDF